MRRFIVKSLVFFAPLISAFLVLETLARNIPNDYSYKHQYLTEHGSDVRVLVLGSSQGLYDVDPAYFSQPAFNAAHVAQPLKFDRFLLEEYIAKMPNLECVCLPVSYFSLARDFEHAPERWREKNYVLYYGYRGRDVRLADHLEATNASPIDLAKSVFDYYCDGKDHVTCSCLGFGLPSADGSQEDLEETGIQAAKRHTAQDDSAVEENEECLSHIIGLCQAHDVRVILFTPPAWRSYRSRLCERQLRRVISTCERMARQWEHVDYLNLLSSPAFVESDFSNADHLNEEGAAKLTKMLDERLRDREHESTTRGVRPCRSIARVPDERIANRAARDVSGAAPCPGDAVGRLDRGQRQAGERLATLIPGLAAGVARSATPPRPCRRRGAAG